MINGNPERIEPLKTVRRYQCQFRIATIGAGVLNEHFEDGQVRYPRSQEHRRPFCQMVRLHTISAVGICPSRQQN